MQSKNCLSAKWTYLLGLNVPYVYRNCVSGSVTHLILRTLCSRGVVLMLLRSGQVCRVQLLG